MSRHDKKVFAFMLVTTTVIPCALMVALRLLGTRDELTSILVVGAFAFTMLGCSFLWDDPPPDGR
jgi:hypothetical protein